MKIWQVAADFPPNTGGVAAHVYELSRSLSDLGENVTVQTTVACGGGDQVVEKFSINRIRVPRFQPFYSLFLKYFLSKHEAIEKPDILHIHGIKPLVPCRGLKAPVVFTNHTSGFLKRIASGKRASRRIGARLEHVSHLLAPSEELLDASTKAGYTGASTYIPNGVDVKRFQPSGKNLRSELNLAEEELVILVARRLVPKNGVLDFAKSLKFVGSIKFKVIIAGDGPEIEAIRKELSSSGLLDRVIFMGNVSNAEMPDVYRTANFSVLPSHMEATSITGLESLATGLALVGTRVGGIPELISSEVNGYLVEKESPAEMGQAIQRCLSNPDRLKYFGANSLKRSKDFSWPKIAEKTLSAYRNLL